LELDWGKLGIVIELCLGELVRVVWRLGSPHPHVGTGFVVVFGEAVHVKQGNGGDGTGGEFPRASEIVEV